MPTRSRHPAHAPASSPAPAAPRGRDGGAPRPWRAGLLALLALGTFLVFSGVLRDGWVLFDDPRLVFAHPHVRHGLRLADALWFLGHAHGENWHPLTSWSHMLDITLFGLDPAGPHAVNAALHALTTALLAWVLYRLTGAWWRSVALAALFGVHPLRVESVAWISERKDVLSGLFLVLALGAYRRWTERPGTGRLAVLLGVAALGLMSKPMLVTLPLLLVLLDVWPLGRLRGGPERPAGAPPVRAPARGLGGLLLEKAPLLALAAASAVVTFLTQRGAGAMVSVVHIPPAVRLGNALLSVWRYVLKSAWPADLAVFYPYPQRLAPLAVALAGAGLIAASALALAQLRRRPWLAVGWLWYLGMLVPVVGLVQVGGQAYADRYTYLPGIGLALALVWGLGELASRGRAVRVALTAAAAAAVVTLAMLTVRQVPIWKDTLTLFGHALRVTPANPIADESMGEAWLRAGRLEPAIEHLERAVRALPAFPAAHTNLGSALALAGRDVEAIEHFRASLALRDDPEAHHDLGFTLLRRGRVDEAIPEFEAALRLDPGLPLTQAMLGRALAARGRLAEAEPRFERALELEPGDLESRRALAALRVQAGRTAEGLAAYREILRRSPDDLDALNNVAWILATHAEARFRSGAEAVRLAERARDRSPRPDAVILSTLAAAYAEAGRFADAVPAAERAVALASAGGDRQQAETFGRQLARYRAGRPFHFGE